MEIKNYKFKISVYSGDIVFAMLGIKSVCERNNTKAEIYIWLDRPWAPSVEGQVHPYGINQYAFDMIKPLLESQPYIAFCRPWKGEQVVDLDELRTKTVSTMPRGSITHWPSQVWPDMHGDAGKAWIHVISKVFTTEGLKYLYCRNSGKVEYVEPTAADGKIIINRTARWRNDMIHYYYLREIKGQLIFSGLPEEHESFCKEWDLQIPLLKVDDFFHLAVAIARCKFMIGNQSLCFALAEAMKTPRILEVCPYAPNVFPVGEHAYQAYHQANFEWLVKDLNERL